MSISVIVPLYNEQANVLPLAEELHAVCATQPGAEIIFVDDGSSDGTWQNIEKAAVRFSTIRGLKCTPNAGQSAALLVGLQKASGDILVTMDGDLQNNPGDIPKLIEQLDQADVVCGYRVNRQDTWSRKVGSRIGNAIRNWVTHDGLKDTGCSLKAFRRACLNDLPPLNGVHRFMGAYFMLHGRRMMQIPVDHRARVHGTSKYTNLKRLPRTALDLFGFYWYRKRLLKLPAANSTS